MRSALAATHPFLWISAAAFAVMTAMVVSSPLGEILDFYVHDDSFYYLKTAENFATGHGSTFDGINYTKGYHPAWFAILAALYWIGVGHDAMVVVGIGVQAGLFLTGLFVLCRAFLAAGVKPLFASAAIGIVFVGLVPVLGWNLLEAGLTVLASAVVMLALIRACESQIKPFWFGLSLSLAALTRTDHLVFLAIGGALFGWQLFRRDRDQWASDAVALMAPVALLVGSYLVLNVVTTGHFMQVSGMVKSFMSEWDTADFIAGLVRFDVRSSWKLGVIVGSVILLGDLRRRRLSGLGAYSIGALVIGAYYLLSYGSSYNYAFWYYIPLYNLLCYSLAAACQGFATSLLHGRPRLVAGSLALALVGFLALRFHTNAMYRGRPAGEREALYKVALVLREVATSPTDRIGAWDAGILGYYGGQVTNLDGLINSVDYFERYLSRGLTPEYIRETAFDYLACFEGDLRAVPLMGTYVEVFRGHAWVILKRSR